MCPSIGELTASVTNLPRQSWDLEPVGSEPVELVRNNFFVFQIRVLNRICPFLTKQKLPHLRAIFKLKGTVSRDFFLLVFFLNQFPPSL
jgi:hypothetical protein